MKSVAKKQVHPAASAMLILIVLGGVQWIWWRVLVYRRPGGGAGAPPPMARMLPSGIRLNGSADITVRTVAGSAEPGSADGPAHSSRLDRPTGIALDPSGNLYVADTGNNRIRLVTAASETSTVAGSDFGYADGPVAQARFNAPCGVCFAPDGAVLVADTGNHCIRRIKDGMVTTLVGKPPASGAQAAGGLGLITGIAVTHGPSPTLLVTETVKGVLEEYTLAGAHVRTVPAPGGSVAVAANPIGAAVPMLGDIVAGSNFLRSVPFGATEDASAAQTGRLFVRHPTGITSFRSGWLVTDHDFGAVVRIANGTARVLSGTVSADGPVRGNRDGTGATAMFGMLCGVVSDGAHYVYVADTGNNSIRRLDISEMAAQ